MRLAAIDIGTNSIHMIVVNVRPDLSFEVIDREKDMVRLGAGGLDGRSITPTAMAAALQTLAKFKRLLAVLGPELGRDIDRMYGWVPRSEASQPGSVDLVALRADLLRKLQLIDGILLNRVPK